MQPGAKAVCVGLVGGGRRAIAGREGVGRGRTRVMMKRCNKRGGTGERRNTENGRKRIRLKEGYVDGRKEVLGLQLSKSDDEDGGTGLR